MAANDGGVKVLAENAEGLVSATTLVVRRRGGVDGNDIAPAPPHRLRRPRRLRVEHVDGPSGRE